MGDGKKRRTRRRLTRWAVPLIEAAASVPEDHAGCYAHPCVSCAAAANLEPGDWLIVNFFFLVRDQVVNQTPMGLDDGTCWITPRLEAWEAALRIYGIPEASHAAMIDGARFLHDAIHDNIALERTASLPRSAFRPVSRIEVIDGR